jgi:hypothetical protein
MARAAEIAALRALGLSLAQVAGVLDGDRAALEPALAAHQTVLEAQIRQLGATVENVRRMRTELAGGRPPNTQALAQLLGPDSIRFELPWPWGGETFVLDDIKPLTYIVGPLGSGKTRLAERIAQALPGAAFLGLDRAAPSGDDPAMDEALTWLVEEGVTISDALRALLAGLQREEPSAIVVDMVEHGLDEATQQALIAHLRRRGPAARPLFLMTRSSAILDLAAVGAHEAIILCPANHSPPMRVAPYPGALGYEAVATCLASPQVRARTAGVVALRPASA